MGSFESESTRGDNSLPEIILVNSSLKRVKRWHLVEVPKKEKEEKLGTGISPCLESQCCVFIMHMRHPDEALSFFYFIPSLQMPRKHATDGSKLKKPKQQQRQMGQDKRENVLSSDLFNIN
jgi:hypothetical protein